MSTNHQPAPLLLAHNLLGRMVAAAQRAGDIGGEFLAAGVRRQTEREIAFRREASASAGTISSDIGHAEDMFGEIIADGVVTPSEQTAYRACLRKPARSAANLSTDLAL